ncbi:hypothetical protein [Sphingomonas quercus]|uniref:Inner membrane protein n=1 Tax=Sphingomonas quercus TaxID=2842451 RepID=A0ABS6BIN4_9SPHN|nr:hypothetical protein [Sphingomonas quercus]MBU3078173.1 hypothetical protein [Sphingomonas quercus]
MASVFEDGPGEAPPASAFVPPPPRRRGWLGQFILLLLAFAAGIAATGWALRHWAPAARYLAPPPPAAAPVVRVVRVPVATAAGKTDAVDPALARQVSAIDAKLDAIDARAREAVGGADRAEGLLVAFAARRAIERGVDLGYIEGLIREHFAATQPQAVATVISGSRAPVTLAELRTGLADAEAALTQGGPAESAWTSFRRELSNLLVLRRTGTDSPAPVDRFDRATKAMEFGQVDMALAEVSRMPGRDGAAAWIAKARRYIAVRNALDTLETAALVDPRPVPSAATPAP